MKVLKRLLALTMSLIIALSANFSVYAFSLNNQFDTPNLSSLNDYKQYLTDEGYPVFTTSRFLAVCDIISQVFRLVTGQWIIPEKKFNVSVDPFLTEVCDYVCQNCGLDLVAIIKNLPETNQVPDLVSSVFKIDTAEFRKQIYAKRDEIYDSGNAALAFIVHFLGVYLSVIKECEIYSVQSEDDPKIYEVRLRLTFKDGGTEEIDPGILINSETGKVSNRDNSGIVGIGFNYDLSELLVYATVDCWMRDFGFCLFYDILANSMPVFFNYVTRRFKFDYDGLEWMIQIWKGNYVITNGGEVGIYNRKPGSFGTYYDCATDEQMMNMTLQVCHGDKVLVDEGPMMHWWINGFNMSDRMYIPSSLTMKFSIDMPDKEMLNAFCESIDNHYMHDVTYTVDGLTVNVVW